VLKFPLNSSDSHHYAIDSCDGIICFTMHECNFKHCNMVVWNPCTRKFKTLPTLNLPSHTLNTLYGFVYDRFTDNYKVIAVACYQYSNSYKLCKTQVKVHTLGTNVWRRIPDFPSENKGIPEGCVGKFVSGAIHWAIKDHQDNDSSWVILSLDISFESYQEILQPDYGIDERLCYFRLGVSRDCLCALAHTNTFLDIWIMTDYGKKGSWTKLFTVPFTEFIDHYYACLLFLYEGNGQALLYFCGKLYVYNYKNGTVKIPEIQSLPSTGFSFNVYVESLVSP
jgi:F-box interacting protein